MCYKISYIETCHTANECDLPALRSVHVGFVECAYNVNFDSAHASLKLVISLLYVFGIIISGMIAGVFSCKSGIESFVYFWIIIKYLATGKYATTTKSQQMMVTGCDWETKCCAATTTTMQLH